MQEVKSFSCIYASIIFISGTLLFGVTIVLVPLELNSS